MTLTKRSLLLGGASAMAGAAWAQTPPERTVILGQVSLSFYAVTGAVVDESLERRVSNVKAACRAKH